MFKLVKIKPTGMRVTLVDGPDLHIMILSGQIVRKNNPDLDIGITDEEGTLVWHS